MEFIDEHLSARRYRGWDPYDGLESRWFRATPLYRFRPARLAWTQLLKWSPVNMRSVLGVPRTLNPKTLALSALALLDMENARPGRGYAPRVAAVLEELYRQRSAGEPAAWGYPFDWQSSAFFAPRGTPNAVCTAFAAAAFLEVHETTRDPDALRTGVAAADFFAERLITRDGGRVTVGYVPALRQTVHNVNLLAAALLARAGRLGGRADLVELASGAAAASIAAQRPDGSWPYGASRRWQWADNFHTGYNLVALREYERYAGDDGFAPPARTAYEHWDRTFFDGPIPKYYSDRRYPLDTHCAAQAVLTYLAFTDWDPAAAGKAERVAEWSLRTLRSRSGLFVFRKHRWGTNRIPYERWSQAWMFRALGALLRERVA